VKPGDSIKGFTYYKTNSMNNEKIFREIDILLLIRMSKINSGLETVTKFLENNDIGLSTPVGGDSEKRIGDVLVDTLKELNQFFREYKDVKDTWQLTTA
jgi:hypothetical protein